MIKDKFNRKAIHISIIAFILTIVLIVVLLLVFKYNIEGEQNLPFKTTKIVIISSAQTDNTTNASAEVIQKNDIYISIEKNENYKKEDAIKKVELNNFRIEKDNNVGIANIYRPSKSKDKLYEYIGKYVVNSIVYTGGQTTYLKGENLEIANQGGIVNFSICVNNLGTINYEGNENIASDGTLLNRINLTNKDVQMNISFDMIIELTSGKSFKSQIKFELPAGDITTDGVCSQEINDLVFKRI